MRFSQLWREEVPYKVFHPDLDLPTSTERRVLDLSEALAAISGLFLLERAARAKTTTIAHPRKAFLSLRTTISSAAQLSVAVHHTVVVEEKAITPLPSIAAIMEVKQMACYKSRSEERRVGKECPV